MRASHGIKNSFVFSDAECQAHVLTIPHPGGSRLHGRPGQMPKTRRRAGDRTAGADWQRGCLIDRAEVPGFYKFCAKGRAPLVKWSISVIGFCTAEGRTSVTGMILEQYRVSVRREGRPIPCFCAWRERGRGGQGDRRDSKKKAVC